MGLEAETGHCGGAPPQAEGLPPLFLLHPTATFRSLCSLFQCFSSVSHCKDHHCESTTPCRAATHQLRAGAAADAENAAPAAVAGVSKNGKWHAPQVLQMGDEGPPLLWAGPAEAPSTLRRSPKEPQLSPRHPPQADICPTPWRAPLPPSDFTCRATEQ